MRCHDIVQAMIIDVHTHIFPPEVIAERQNFLDGEPAFAAIYSDPKAPMVDGPGLINAMNEDGVDVSWAMGFPWVKEENAALHNEYLFSAIAESQGRLRGMACVRPPARWALAQAKKALASGIHGLGELAFYDSDIDVDSLDPLAKLCAEADVPLLLHTNEPVGHIYPGKAPMTLASLYRLIKANPRTKFVMAHMAGGLFFYTLLKKEVSGVLENVWIDTAAAPFLYKPAAYGLAVQLLGPEKVLLGTDYPLLRVPRYKKEMSDPSSGLNEKQINQIMGLGAEKLLP